MKQGEIGTIIQSDLDCYDYGGRSGVDAEGFGYAFLTNFPTFQSPIYAEAIKRYKEEGLFFAFCDQAFGFNEEEGYEFPVSDSVGLYVRDNREVVEGEDQKGYAEFWKHLHEVEEELKGKL